MTNEQLDLLKRMALNAGAEEGLGMVQRSVFLDEDGSLLRFAMAVAEDCAKRAEDRGDAVSASVIRNLYREQ